MKLNTHNIELALRQVEEKSENENKNKKHFLKINFGLFASDVWVSERVSYCC